MNNYSLDALQWKALSQFKGAFLGRIAHELRSPMSRLMSLLQLVLNDLSESPEEEREFIGEAYQSALHFMALLDEVITVSKLDSGKEFLKQEFINLNSLLEDVEHHLILIARNYNLKLTVCQPDPEIIITTDPKRLKQVLLYLIDACIEQLEDGEVIVNVNYTNNFLKVICQLSGTVKTWGESVDTLEISPSITSVSDIHWSQGMKLLLCQHLLAVMRGKLIVELPDRVMIEMIVD